MADEERNIKNLSDIDWSVLSGPRVSRRTMMRLAAFTGAVPFASWLAACGGDDDEDDDAGGGDTTDEPTATSGGGDEGGDEEPTATEEADDAEPTATSGQVSGTAAEATPTPDESAQSGGTLVMGVGTITQILTLDPAQVTQGIVAGEFVSNIFSSLVQFDENLGLVADLAEDWSVSEDGTEYTFNLRDGLTHHNGDSLTAEDFVYTYERTTNEDFASPHANKLNLVTDISAVDDLTVSITLSAPFAPFLAVACSRGPGRALTPISKRAIEEMGDEEFGLAPVGCGPFKVVEGSREVGQGLELEPFEEWYGGRPLLDRIVLQIIPEPSSQISALEAGDVDMLNIVDETGVEQIQANDDLVLIQAPGTSWSGLTMNFNNPPWDDPRARMAVSKAIDRDDYVERTFFGLATPAHSAIAPAFGWVYHADDPDNPQAYDLEEAKRLAEEVGLAGTTARLMALSDNSRAQEVIRNAMTGDWCRGRDPAVAERRTQ
ncbi:MAG: ABC transporter substrate-binding protein [Thermomicrobiales bacterium]